MRVGRALKEKGLKKEDYVRPYGARMARRHRFGVYFIFKSLEQGPKFSSRRPTYPTEDPTYLSPDVIRQRLDAWTFWRSCWPPEAWPWTVATSGSPTQAPTR